MPKYYLLNAVLISRYGSHCATPPDKLNEIPPACERQFALKKMSWTIANPLNSIAMLKSGARFTGALVLAREGANAMLSATRKPQERKSSVYQTKTNRMRVQKKKTTAKVTKAVASYVKKTIENSKDLKGRSFGVSASMTHTTLFTANVTANVIEGTFDYQRIGDTIQPREFVANYSFIAPATAGAYAYRILVFWSGAETFNTALSSGGFSQNQVFQPTIATDTQFAAIPNPKAVTVLADRIVNINSNISATQDIMTGSIRVKLGGAKFPYASNSSIYGKRKNLYICVLSYVAGGTAGTTSTGLGFVNYDFRYADS